jgi:hypothetical protein
VGRGMEGGVYEAYGVKKRGGNSAVFTSEKDFFLFMMRLHGEQKNSPPFTTYIVEALVKKAGEESRP